MALRETQKGAVGQLMFLVVAIVTGRGEVVAYVPTADDEQRDAEIHRRGGSVFALGVQVKIVGSLYRIGRHRHRYLRVVFRMPASRIIDSPGFYYFFAHFDFKEMRFAEPMFLVPSEVVHRRCRLHKGRADALFNFTASMDPESRDRWSPYRVAAKDVGTRILQILNALPKKSNLTLAGQRNVPGMLYVGRPPRRRSQLRRAV